MLIKQSIENASCWLLVMNIYLSECTLILDEVLIEILKKIVSAVAEISIATYLLSFDWETKYY